jgi:hypothetical protein
MSLFCTLIFGRHSNSKPSLFSKACWVHSALRDTAIFPSQCRKLSSSWGHAKCRSFISYDNILFVILRYMSHIYDVTIQISTKEAESTVTPVTRTDFSWSVCFLPSQLNYRREILASWNDINSAASHYRRPGSSAEARLSDWDFPCISRSTSWHMLEYHLKWATNSFTFFPVPLLTFSFLFDAV